MQSEDSEAFAFTAKHLHAKTADRAWAWLKHIIPHFSYYATPRPFKEGRIGDRDSRENACTKKSVAGVGAAALAAEVRAQWEAKHELEQV